MKKLNDSRYKYEMIQIKFRWVDWCRIRAVFPAEKNESASSYFKRLARMLQEKFK